MYGYVICHMHFTGSKWRWPRAFSIRSYGSVFLKIWVFSHGFGFYLWIIAALLFYSTEKCVVSWITFLKAEGVPFQLENTLGLHLFTFMGRNLFLYSSIVVQRGATRLRQLSTLFDNGNKGRLCHTLWCSVCDGNNSKKYIFLQGQIYTVFKFWVSLSL